MYPDYDDKGKIFTQVITKKPVDVIIQTTSHQITGKLHIRPEDRIKDELNSNEQFLAVTDATILDDKGNPLHQCSFLSINRSHIIWLIPIEDPEERPQE